MRVWRAIKVLRKLSEDWKNEVWLLRECWRGERVPRLRSLPRMDVL